MQRFYQRDTEKNFWLLWDMQEKDWKKLMEEKTYKVSDAPLSYRQINELDKAGLLPKREDDGQWRTFNFRELVYLYAVDELKRYGIKNDQLRPVRDAFLDEKNFEQSTIASALTVMHTQVVMALINNEKGYDVCFYDAIKFATIGGQLKSFICINISEIVNEIFEKTGKGKLEYETFETTINRFYPTDKERRVIRMVKDKRYKEIKVKKKNGELETVYGLKNILDGLSDEKLTEIIRGKQFGNFKVSKRDGKSIVIEEDIEKLSG